MNPYQLLSELLWEEAKIDLDEEHVEEDGELLIYHRAKTQQLKGLVDKLPEGVELVHYDYEPISFSFNSQGFEEWLNIRIVRIDIGGC